MNKLALKLSSQKSDDTLYTNWQISKLSNDFSEFYYKSVLLHDISIYLNQGVLKKDVIIFNSSIKINNQYTKYRSSELDLNNPTDVVKYYHLGSPISLFPNKQVLVLHEFFEAYREYFSITSKYKLNLGNKRDDLSELFNISRESSDVLNFSFVEFFSEKITENNELESDNRRKCLQEIQSKFKIRDNELIELFNSFDEKQLSKQFDYIFNRFERPIVGIKMEDDKIKLLGNEFFVQSKFTYSNDRFLETRSISQNSPLEMILNMSIIVVPYLWLILREKRDVMEMQNQNGQLDQEIARLDTEIKNLEKISEDEDISLNQSTPLPNLKKSVIQKGESVLDELEAKVMQGETTT